MGKVEDLTGKKFGRLMVKKHAFIKKGMNFWLCECDCGNETTVCTSNLKLGRIKSCGCITKENGQKRLIDLTNKKFGKLIAIKYMGSSKWLCKCECGNEKIIDGSSLKRGITKSCGCLNKNPLTHIKHGLTHTRIYRIWADILQRCNNPKDTGYHKYGGRGIKVCQEWYKFLPFYEWATNNGYKDDLTIDRIDVNGNYEPSNCRWATIKEQSNNTRRNHFLTYKGVTKTITQWEEFLGFNNGCIRNRINNGWSIERALTIPTYKKENKNVRS